MDKEIIDKAIEENIPAYYPDATYETGYTQGFKDGVRWLFSKELRERLTEDEKRLIRSLWSEYRDRAECGVTDIDHIYGRAGVVILHRVFGGELFKEE